MSGFEVGVSDSEGEVSSLKVEVSRSEGEMRGLKGDRSSFSVSETSKNPLEKAARSVIRS